MILKFNRNSKGRSGPIEYLLDELRVKNGTAYVIRGNQDITKALIRSIDRKHKYLSVGLMFAKGEFITEEQEKEIIESFVDLVFVGLDPVQYNYLVVKHIDKHERVELNFIIPRECLSSGKDLDLYSHRRDMPLFDMWKNGINAKFGLFDPNDPRRERTVAERTDSARERSVNDTIVVNRKTIDETLHQLVKAGAIQSRDHMIQLLKQNGYEITRKNIESISIKHDDIGKKALRLRGGIYSEKFTSIRSIEDISKARERKIEEYDRRVAQGETRPNGTTYQRYLQSRIERHKKRYLRPEPINTEKSQVAQKRDPNNMDSKNNDNDQRRITNGRVRAFIETSRRKRKERIKRSRKRESQLLEQIKVSNFELSESLRESEQRVFGLIEKARGEMENSYRSNAKRIDAKIIDSDEKIRDFTVRVRELLDRIIKRTSKFTKSIQGVINDIKTLKLFKKAKENVVSIKRQRIHLSPRR